MTLTKDKLALKLQEAGDLQKDEARAAVDRLFEIIKATLESGEDLLISGFRKWEV